MSVSRYSLNKSTVTVFTFWWIVISAYWFGGLETFKSVSDQIFIDGTLPSLSDAVEPISIATQYWTVPILFIMLGSFFLGVISSYIFVISKLAISEYRVRKREGWNEVSLTFGEIEKPQWFSKNEFSLEGVNLGVLAMIYSEELHEVDTKKLRKVKTKLDPVLVLYRVLQNLANDRVKNPKSILNSSLVVDCKAEFSEEMLLEEKINYKGRHSVEHLSLLIRALLDGKIEQDKLKEILFPVSKKEMFTDEQLELFIRIIGYINFHRDAYVGLGHAETLIRHTEGVVRSAVEKSHDALDVIIAAGHDIGKVKAWKKDKEGQWVCSGDHDQMGARIISVFDEFLKLSDREKRIIQLCVGYSHKPARVPSTEGVSHEEVYQHIKTLKGLDKSVTKSEKKKITKNLKSEDSTIVRDAFVRSLQETPFNTKSSSRNVKAIGFKKNGLVYLLEPGFRDIFLQYLPEDIAAALGGGYRTIGNMSPATVELINFLKNIGWLVEEGNGMTSECGLWCVASGKRKFSGVLAVRLPEEILTTLPEDTEYTIEIECPLKMPAAKDLGTSVAAKEVESVLSKEEIESITKKAKMIAATTNGDFKSILKTAIANAEAEKNTA